MRDLTFSVMPDYDSDFSLKGKESFALMAGDIELTCITSERYNELLKAEEELNKMNPTMGVEDLGDDN